MQIQSNTIAIGSQVLGGQVQMHWPLHHSISSLATDCSGEHLLPRIRQMDNLWKSLLVVVPSSSPVCLARALPNFFTSAMALGCQAPRLVYNVYYTS